MSEQPNQNTNTEKKLSKLPSVSEVFTYTGKLCKDVTLSTVASVKEIVHDYKDKRKALFEENKSTPQAPTKEETKDE